jgi:L-alanine-DL-glutamate epimerase-like enolase superfamily enzyme
MPTIQTIRVTPVSFPLHQPFVTAAGRKTQTRNVQVSLRLSNGIEGVAEGSSSLAMPSQSQENMERVLKALIHEIREKDIRDYRPLIQTCWRQQPFHPTAVAAMECAIIDAYTRNQGQALYQFLGGKKTSVESDLTLSVGTPAKLHQKVKAALKKGFRMFMI